MLERSASPNDAAAAFIREVGKKVDGAHHQDETQCGAGSRLVAHDVLNFQASGKNRAVPDDLSPDLPDFVQIEPVGQCNLQCRMCPVQFRKDGPPYGPAAFIDFDAFASIVDQFPNLRRLQIQGLGEPFMHPRFLEMVRYAANRGIEVSVNTNLTLITPSLARETIASGLQFLYASIDGATAPTFESVRIRARFEKVVRNLTRLLEARSQAGASTPAIELVFVAMRQNIDELPELVRLGATWGVDAVNVQQLCHDFAESTLPAHYLPMRQFVDEQTLENDDPVRVASVFEQAAAVAQTYGLPIRLPRLRRSAKKPGCNWPWKGAYFSYAGDAMPCCMVSTPDRAMMGNALHDGVAEVWNGERYRTFRERLASENPPEICRSCAVYNGRF